MKPRILITGAGSGLGRGLTLCLAAQGHPIVATDLQENAALETAELANSASNHHGGALVTGCKMDVCSQAEISAVVERFPDTGILVNNAGFQHVDRFEEFPVEKFRLMLDVVLTGSFLLCQALLPHMRARGYGRLIHIGSIHSLVASPYKAAYVTAKHGLLGLSKVLALETADVDITSNTICPSYIRTPLVDSQIRKQAAARGISEGEVIDQVMLKPMPKGEFISYEEVAGTIEYLASAAGRNATGQTITLDGGWTAQ